MARSLVGTPYYLSPEIIEARPYSFKSDIWSLGILLYEMCALEPPFKSEGYMQLAMRICMGNYPPIPSQYSSELSNLINSILNREADERPDIKALLKVPIIRSRVLKFLSQEEFE